ncbi:MAG: hypothetical protein A2822_04510 [Candidatus Staskawiczbacteria bacterium RIFCSPHIGHO2_01_FULL_41_41]|uniref:2-oxoacid dehydrogenase acyltransferase catalytic domain-containing protein n=1 Tax=Candidatus Staskawiczbacteria bacterium RIFCSPHIGHO2_01_FULL_41_41 TaxID=1802203 RepID=A0A1G2HS73_9BACT|nr:MAG: hypothetical protein A2822_04510 [Candidatus Staskawiczbacteria bacterium RIFCSPHIGHO2_01_FULL_41_41]HLD80275.1 2-oxo acid dehydrogenase subunit E2 [Candidatus Nanoarchaeia archaeon]
MSNQTNSYLVGYNCGISIEIESFPISQRSLRYQQQENPSLSLGDQVIYAVAQVLPKFPEFNSYFSGEVTKYPSINIAYSINLGKGPKKVVLKNADKLSLVEVSYAVKAFAFKYMRENLTEADTEGATTSILNLSFFNPYSVVTPLFADQAALLTIASEREIVKIVQEKAVAQKVFNLCLAYDVRVADCQRALQFLNAIKDILEKKEA